LRKFSLPYFGKNCLPRYGKFILPCTTQAVEKAMKEAEEVHSKIVKSKHRTPDDLK